VSDELLQPAAEPQLPPLIVVVGPTASGKSQLAAALGAHLDGEVVSADSVQVYRHFNIGSGKPQAAELGLCPHHLLDIREPFEVLEASVWAKMAAETIDDILGRGKVPIVCGGTFLWVRALLFGLADAPPGDEDLRARHRALEREHGRPYLHQMLKNVDQASAARLHENDFVRVSRALEVHELTGRPLSALQQEHGFATPRYAARLLGVDWPREQYEERLRARVAGMFSDGFVQETQELIQRGYATTRAMASVGYRQVCEALSAETPLTEAQLPLDEAALLEKVVQSTRIFARRQRTWLRDAAVERVDPAALSDEATLRLALSRLGLDKLRSPLS
jgi:tRNA dimethylallyltransferase